MPLEISDEIEDIQSQIFNDFVSPLQTDLSKAELIPTSWKLFVHLNELHIAKTELV